LLTRIIDITHKQGYNMFYKHTDKNTGLTFKGEYVGGPVTLDIHTGKQGTQICLKSKDSRYKWVEQSECVRIKKL